MGTARYRGTAGMRLCDDRQLRECLEEGSEGRKEREGGGVIVAAPGSWCSEPCLSDMPTQGCCRGRPPTRPGLYCSAMPGIRLLSPQGPHVQAA